MTRLDELLLASRRSWWGRVRFRAGIVWRALIGAPRALWALLLLVLLKRRARAEVKALNPELDRMGQQLAKVDEGDPLVTRYCLVTVATGRKVELEGAPGKVALFRSHSQALQKRRRGERIQRVYVPASKLEPSLVASKRPPRGVPLAVLLLAAAIGCADGLTAPRAHDVPPIGAVPALTSCDADVVCAPEAEPVPEMLECWTTWVAETLWVGRTPYIEHVARCDSLRVPPPAGRAQ